MLKANRMIFDVDRREAEIVKKARELRKLMMAEMTWRDRLYFIVFNRIRVTDYSRPLIARPKEEEKP